MAPARIEAPRTPRRVLLQLPASIPAMLRGLPVLFLRLLNGMAADTACRAGGALGVLAWRLGIRRRVVNEQLGGILGLRGQARKRVSRRCYATMGATFLELWTIGGPDGLERNVRLLNPRWMARVAARHPACVFVTPHLGSWDGGARGLAISVPKLLTYAKAQHSAEVDALTNRQRERMGYRVLMARHADRTAAVTVLRALRDGGYVGLMADQKPADEEAEPAYFLGRPTHCHRGPGFFATRAGVPIVPGLCVRVRAGELVMLVGRPAIVPAAEATQAVMDWYAAMIAGVPGQYFWHHKRFRGTPPALPPRATEPWRERGLRLIADPRF